MMGKKEVVSVQTNQWFFQILCVLQMYLMFAPLILEICQ